MFQSKNFSSNENQSKYGNKKPYNNIPPAANEELAPMLMTKEMFKDKSIIRDNIETWNINGHKIPVAFAPIQAGTLDNWIRFFNASRYHHQGPDCRSKRHQPQIWQNP